MRGQYQQQTASKSRPGIQPKQTNLDARLWVWLMSIYICFKTPKRENIFHRDQSTPRWKASFHCRNIYHLKNIPPWSFFMKIMILKVILGKARRRAEDKLALDSVEQRGKDVKAAFPCKSIKAVMQWENTVKLPWKNKQRTANASEVERTGTYAGQLKVSAVSFVYLGNKGR